MTKDAFKDCMLALMAMAPKELKASAVEVYWVRLSKQGYADEDLQSGTNTLIDNHHWRAFPKVSEFIDACSEARQKRLEREYEAHKKKENEYRTLDMDQMLARGEKRTKSPEAQAAIHNTLALLRNEIDLRTWCAGQKVIFTDKASQEVVHRIESGILVRRGQEVERG